MVPLTGLKPAIYTLEECCIFSCATEAYWCPTRVSNPEKVDFESTMSTDCISWAFGTCGGSRTLNLLVLSEATLPIGLRKHIVVLQERFELSPLQGLSLLSLPVGRLEHTGIPERT